MVSGFVQLRPAPKSVAHVVECLFLEGYQSPNQDGPSNISARVRSGWSGRHLLIFERSAFRDFGRLRNAANVDMALRGISSVQ